MMNLEHPNGWLGAQAEGLRAKRRALMNEIRQSVAGSRRDVEILKGDARGFVMTIAGKRHQAALATKQATQAFVDHLHHDVNGMLDQARSDRLAAAKQGAQQRGELITGVRHNVQAMMAQARHGRIAAQQEGARNRSELMAHVGQQVRSISSNIQDLLAAAKFHREEIAEGLAIQADADRQQRETFRGHLVTDVRDTLVGAQRDLQNSSGQWRERRKQALANVQQEVAELLTAVCGRPFGIVAKRPAVVPPRRNVAPAVAPEPAKAAPIEVQPAAPSATPADHNLSMPVALPEGDDLTAISGIGKAMQRRLREIGITRYAQLAVCKAEELREQLGELSRIASVESWIEQATQLKS